MMFILNVIQVVSLKMLRIYCKLYDAYFELLLRDISAVWVQVIQNNWYYVSTAEVIGSKSREQHTLSSTSHLR